LLPVEVQYGFPAGGEIGTGTNIHFRPLNAKFYDRFDADITQIGYKKGPMMYRALYWFNVWITI